MKDTLFSPETRQFTLKVCIILAIAFICWLLYTLQSILLMFAGAIFVSLLLSPIVSYFTRWRIRRWHVPEVMAILMSFGVVLLFVALFILAIIPIFVDIGNNTKQAIQEGINSVQIQAQSDFPFLNSLPFNTGKIIRSEFDTEILSKMILSGDKTTLITDNLFNNVDAIKALFEKGFGQISDLGFSFASGITSSVLFVALFSLVLFFTLLDRKRLLKWFLHSLPKNIETYFTHRQEAVNNAVHSWLKGQIKLAGVMFIINFIGLWIVYFLGVPVNNIFALALIAGVMEFVPYAGPVLSWLAAFLIVLVSPDAGIGSLVTICILYVIFQQIEGNIMVPLIMSKTMDLSALYILLMTLAGATLGGMIGVLIAVPLASILHIFYVDWMHYRKNLQD